MAWAAGATVAAISARCKFIASVLQAGMIRAAPLPSFGQTAPKMLVEAVRWSRGALGPVPRLAQRRVILFFWPCGPRRRTRFLSCRGQSPSCAQLPPGARGSFFKILDRALGLRMVTRTGGAFAVAHGSQLPAERLLGDSDAEFLEDPLRQIDQPPAHHAMHRRDRATLDHAGDGLPLSVVELGRLSCRPAIQETVRTAGVEAQHPVPDDLKSDTADLGRLGARCPIVDSREC